jgi:predicted GNAT family acetyltransferase
MTQTGIRRSDENSRYEISVDGELAGFAAYADRGEQRIFYHTEIAEAFGGRGLSTVLVTEALADVRAAGKHVVPVCRLVAAFLRKHPDQSDLADPVAPETLHWLDETLG